MDAKEFNRLLKKITKNYNAFEKIYMYYFSRVVRYLSIKYNQMLAEDAVQEFFSKLKEFAKLGKYVEYPTSWIYKCCENIAKNKIKQEIKYSYIIEQDRREFEQKYEEELYDELYDAIKLLNASTQVVLRMHYWEGYSLIEIAHELNANYNTIKQKHKRALSALKKLIKDVTI